jgi:hypothetical protein
MTWLLMTLLMLTFVTPTHAAAAPTTVHVYLAVPPGQPVTPEDVTQADALVQQATAWWTDHHPAHPTFTVRAPQVVVMPQPGTAGWLQDMPVRPADGVAVWVYVNHDPFYLFPNYSGYQPGGLAYGGNALVVFDQQSLPWATQAAITHELGHVLYQLPDWYTTDPTCSRGIDIMCHSSAGYINGIVGCRSMAWLGYPCDVPETPDVPPIQSPVRWPPLQSVYLPLVDAGGVVASSTCMPAWLCEGARP